MEENRNLFIESDEERSRRRRARIEEMKRQKRRAEFIQKRVIPLAGLFSIAGIILFIICFTSKGKKEEAVLPFSGEVVSENTENRQEFHVQEESVGAESENISIVNANAEVGIPENDTTAEFGDANIIYPDFQAKRTVDTGYFSDTIISEYGVLIDVDGKNILAAKDEKARICPASMTKILTVLTAANALGLVGENWENHPVLQDTFQITIEITDYSFVHDCSNVGFLVDEKVPVIDLFYGTVLPSGADAALGLACYVAGSQEKFVEMMNQELERMGLSETTHFTNCVGLYDDNHYSTVYDMAIILKNATDNPFCRKVLNARTYTTTSTQQHPEGLIISNWFLRRIEDKDTHGEVLCAKTGFVVQSKSCAASLAKDNSGKEYICVTAGSTSSWRCIYDQVELYQKYLE